MLSHNMYLFDHGCLLYRKISCIQDSLKLQVDLHSLENCAAKHTARCDTWVFCCHTTATCDACLFCYRTLTSRRLFSIIRNAAKAACKNSPKHILNFSVHLLIHYFPELFGIDNHRLKHNVVGTRGKERLDPIRVASIKQYVKKYFSETANSKTWTVTLQPPNYSI